MSEGVKCPTVVEKLGSTAVVVRASCAAGLRSITTDNTASTTSRRKAIYDCVVAGRTPRRAKLDSSRLGCDAGGHLPAPPLSRTDSITDSTDCLPTLLSISVFFTF